MRKAGLVVLFFLSVGAYGQVDITDNIGAEEFTFTGVEMIFDGNGSERTYYKIEDGQLHYYLVNEYQGRNIQYIHTQCEIKKLDLKSVKYLDYDTYGKFMYIDTKNHDRLVKEERTDLDLVDHKTLEKDNKENSTFILIISNQATGDNLIKRLKKGK